ncbi:hypothetical protein BP5796_09026 [Coleophoma crateriformis]|uniref:Uncharacterized protein n=1 Tax=Coleophoma crateriformis TaxID=565419 RepID=A0A3D8R2U5_9HELO|nr:hypothetical protein BP5796_09026 [Coleophoma crateriformis]
MSFNMEEALLLSSPDPLGDSTELISPPKRRTPKMRRSLPMPGSSPTKQTFELDVGNELSPQKIRVTVEAGEERGNLFSHYVDRRAISPSPYRPQVNRRGERTTTTTVPLKGLSDTEDAPPAVTPKRGRGRPRKSGTPITTKKKGRASTPAKSPRKRKSIGSLVDGDDSGDWDFQIGKGVSMGRGKGRSRSRSQKATSRSATPAPSEPAAAEQPELSIASKRGRRRSIAPEEIVVLRDENESSRQVDQDTEMYEGELEGVLSPLNHNIPRHIRDSPIAPAVAVEDHEQIDNDAAPPNAGPSSPPRPSSVKMPDSSQRSVTYPTPPSSSKEPQNIQAEDITNQSPNLDEEMEYELENQDQEVEREERSEPQSEDEEQVEFDTILESEEFSMISIDSVPSLREHFSSPLVEELETPKEGPRPKSSLRITETVESQNDSFSSISNSILEAATPAPFPRNRDLLSAQETKQDDSFSSIPAEILEAATPAPNAQSKFLLSDRGRHIDDSSPYISSTLRKTHLSRLLPKKRSKLNESLTSVVPAAQQKSTPATESSKLVADNDNSFSAIPSSILEAATPAPARQISSRSPGIQQASISTASAPTLLAPRLSISDSTPSPITEAHDATENADNKENTTIASEQTAYSQANELSFLDSHMRSSPPSLHPRSFAKSLHEEPLYPDIAATPATQFSSPSLPPPILSSQPSRRPSIPQSERLGLSSATRAGRALQDLVVPSSPRSRSQSLGSPFKSPLTERRSSSPTRESQIELEARRDSRTLPLPKLDLANNVFANLGPLSQGRERSSSFRPGSEDHRDSPSHATASKSIQFEDPFSNSGSKSLRSPSPEEKRAYSLGLPGVSPHSNSVLSNRKSLDQSMMSVDVMSWQADVNTPDKDVHHENSSAPNAGIGSARGSIRTSAQRQAALEAQWAAERAATSRQIRSASKREVVVIDSDSESQFSKTPSAEIPAEVPAEERLEEDEDYDLLLETINSSSPQIPQREQEEEDTGVFGASRRRRVRSTWRQNSNGSAHSGRASRKASPKYTVLQSKDFESKKEQPAINHASLKQNLLSDEDVDMSYWSIPQKVNFTPKVRSSAALNLSALLASPGKDLPVLSNDLEEASPRTASNYGSNPEASVGRTKPMTEIDGAAESDISNPTSFKKIPQKAVFKPRVRSNGIADLSSMLNSPVKSMPVLPSSSREERQEVTTSPTNAEDSVAVPQIEESFVVTTESSSIPEPTYTPVPQKAAFRPQVREAGNTAMSDKFIISPVKSTFMPKLTGETSRDDLFRQPATVTKPLKMASIGRTNSLTVVGMGSPQRQPPDYSDRDEKENQYINNRTSQWCETVRMAVPQPLDHSPTKSILRSPDRQLFPESTPGKNVAWVSSSPSPSNDNTLLSATTWSNDHWELLKQIIEAWKPEGWTRDPTCPKVPSNTPKRRRSFHETRVVSKLLGKVIHSQGERMRLEQWHLEAVDEFREEVPGWQEVPICLRLLALIIGAERRENGTVHLRAEMRARGDDPDKEWKERKAAAKLAKAKSKAKSNEAVKGKERGV